jgi:hypothetical protein
MLVGFSQGGCQVILFHCFEFFISLISLLSLLGFSDMAGRLEGCLSEGLLCSLHACAPPRLMPCRRVRAFHAPWCRVWQRC